jgi:hypothetical protein
MTKIKVADLQTLYNFVVETFGNVSGGNQPLRANYENFNLSHTMLIRRDTQRRWEEWIAKAPSQITPPTSHEFCKSPLPPPMSSALDQDCVA